VSRDNGGRQQPSFCVVVGVLLCCALGEIAFSCNSCYLRLQELIIHDNFIAWIYV